MSPLEEEIDKNRSRKSIIGGSMSVFFEKVCTHQTMRQVRNVDS